MLSTSAGLVLGVVWVVGALLTTQHPRTQLSLMLVLILAVAASLVVAEMTWFGFWLGAVYAAVFLLLVLLELHFGSSEQGYMHGIVGGYRGGVLIGALFIGCCLGLGGGEFGGVATHEYMVWWQSLASEEGGAWLFSVLALHQLCYQVLVLETTLLNVYILCGLAVALALWGGVQRRPAVGWRSIGRGKITQVNVAWRRQTRRTSTSFLRVR